MEIEKLNIRLSDSFRIHDKFLDINSITYLSQTEYLMLFNLIIRNPSEIYGINGWFLHPTHLLKIWSPNLGTQLVHKKNADNALGFLLLAPK